MFPSDLSKKEIRGARRAARGVSNPLGRLIIAQMMPFQSTMAKEGRGDAAWLSATGVVVAAALYHRSHGSEPPTLQALVDAGLLKGVPLDPFGVGPMRYDAGQRLFWSVGPDGKGPDLDKEGRLTVNIGQYVWPTDGQFRRP